MGRQEAGSFLEVPAPATATETERINNQCDSLSWGGKDDGTI
ncbi:MAG: hypothetical protein WB780_15785 [Candidatus Acidiferrales bacterium]